jgi:hypothetical protein
VGHGIEKAPDIRVEHPVHSLPKNADVQGVQRIVLTASWSEPIGKPDEVLLVDSFQNCRDRLLDGLVLYTQNGERPPRPVSLRDVCPSGRAGAVAAFVYDRGDPSVSLRGFLRRPATSRRRCLTLSPVQAKGNSAPGARW